MKVNLCGQVAQLVEQRTENPRVGGSIPSLATNKISKLESLKGDIILFGPHSGPHWIERVKISRL